MHQHPENADFSIRIKASGSSIFPSDRHHLKAPSLITVQHLGTTTFQFLLQMGNYNLTRSGVHLPV